MKVYARKISLESKSRLKEVKHDLGIQIVHHGETYTLSEDNCGNLILRSIDKTQLVLYPEASNSVKIASN